MDINFFTNQQKYIKHIYDYEFTETLFADDHVQIDIYKNI